MSNVRVLGYKMINVSENEEEVLELLKHYGAIEVGQIVSPDKEQWFKHCHYLMFSVVGWPYQLAYSYQSKNRKLYGKSLEILSLSELETILAVIYFIKILL